MSFRSKKREHRRSVLVRLENNGKTRMGWVEKESGPQRHAENGGERALTHLKSQRGEV